MTGYISHSSGSKYADLRAEVHLRLKAITDFESEFGIPATKLMYEQLRSAVDAVDKFEEACAEMHARLTLALMVLDNPKKFGRDDIGEIHAILAEARAIAGLPGRYSLEHEEAEFEARLANLPEPPHHAPPPAPA